MRFLTRVHACVAAIVALLLYFGWLRPSPTVQTSIQSAWKGRAHRLVVFGDDWSDIGQYRASPPPRSTLSNRDPDRGELWVEALCEELNCDFIDNFARSVPLNIRLETVGSLVNSNIFANATSARRNQTLVLFDFETQVQQFIDFEKRKSQLPGRIRKIDEWTVFTVLFGIWDLLEYSTLETEAAVFAIERSIYELIHNLDILADHAGSPIKVVVPRLMDVTFLPRFSSRKNESVTVFAQQQHQLVFLWTYWNMVLHQASVEWGNGDLFMPDLNGIVMNQVRAKQLYSKQISDASGFGKQAPLFDEVERPCLALRTFDNPSTLEAAAREKCIDPPRHLFWDDFHLGGPAHQLIGREAARLVDSNHTVNFDARERARQGATADQKNQSKKSPSFDLKFPPGY